jgi:hypothetical protein
MSEFMQYDAFLTRSKDIVVSRRAQAHSRLPVRYGGGIRILASERDTDSGMWWIHEFEGDVCTFFPSFDNIANFAPLIFRAIQKAVSNPLISELYETSATHVRR